MVSTRFSRFFFLDLLVTNRFAGWIEKARTKGMHSEANQDMNFYQNILKSILNKQADIYKVNEILYSLGSDPFAFAFALAAF
jgi:hypothetical protein